MSTAFSWFIIFAFGLASLVGVMQQVLVAFEMTNICVDIPDGLFCNLNITLNPLFSCISL